MLLGYFQILLAAFFWGGSAVLSKHLGRTIDADALLLSQARVTVGWVFLAVGLLLFRRDALRVNPRDLWRFGLLGLIGLAGANFFLYNSFKGMDVAVADLIQFMAPALVVAWMALRGREPLDAPKLLALALSLVGCALALGLLDTGWRITAPLYIVSAVVSAFCYAFLIVWGKTLTSRYSMPTFLHYALLGATLFWCLIVPPWQFAARVAATPAQAAILVGFGVSSVLLPYLFFFAGLKRIPASRAGIVSTFEPVVVAVGGALFLGEHLGPWQIGGVVLVLVSIAILELTSAPPKLSATKRHKRHKKAPTVAD